MVNAFQLKVPRRKCNPRFLVVHDEEAHRSTRLLINELLSTFHDKDGEFIKRFQTTEFESRLLDLYLHACLREAGARSLMKKNPDLRTAHFTRGSHA